MVGYKSPFYGPPTLSCKFSCLKCFNNSELNGFGVKLRNKHHLALGFAIAKNLQLNSGLERIAINLAINAVSANISNI